MPLDQNVPFPQENLVFLVQCCFFFPFFSSLKVFLFHESLGNRVGGGDLSLRVQGPHPGRVPGLPYFSSPLKSRHFSLKFSGSGDWNPGMVFGDRTIWGAGRIFLTYSRLFFSFLFFLCLPCTVSRAHRLLFRPVCLPVPRHSPPSFLPPPAMMDVFYVSGSSFPHFAVDRAYSKLFL